jgi:integrase
MASLYKKPIVSVDPCTGRKTKRKSKKWWGRFRDVDGSEKRVPLATDKKAAQAMLNELVVKVERTVAGLVDPAEEHLARPLQGHLDDFAAYLKAKGNSRSHCVQTVGYSRKLARDAGFVFIGDISGAQVQEFLGRLRARGKSVATCNHYLRAFKGFSRWLVREQRTSENRLAHVGFLNEELERRHDRRALQADELDRLIEAARVGPRIEGISGPDRAIMYVLGAWTGFRKGEIGSLTLRSFRLDETPATVTVAACYSKRKRTDTQVLHPEVVRLVKEWLATKPGLESDDILFPVSRRVSGIERKTAKMVKLDLAAARQRWLAEAASDQDRSRREQSDFLVYRNAAGRYADFHAMRHTFISNLTRSGVPPKLAQTLARHSDINLTMQVYTHVELEDQTAAIAGLPGPRGSLDPA